MNYSKELIKQLYASMMTIRLVEESFVELILNGAVKCPVHLCSGEEAIPVGISACLNGNDLVFGNHRSHGHYLAKGGSLSAMIAEIYCKETGCSKGRGGSMHLAAPEIGFIGSAPIVGGTISLAMGAALSCKLKGNGNLAVSYFGDGATGEGVLFECLNFSAIKKLPIIYVCENNLYSTHMPIDEIRANRQIAKIAAAYDIKNYTVDGNDVLAMYDVAKEATEYCRRGEGPIFLECLTYRQRGHVGPDDNVQGTHTDIRPQSEINEWLQKDPIARLEKYIEENDLFTHQELNIVKEEIAQRISCLHQEASLANFPAKEDLEKYVFAK